MFIFVFGLSHQPDKSLAVTRGDFFHAIEVIGKEGDELQYKSNWLLGNEVKGSWEVVLQQMEAYGYQNVKKEKFKWYIPKEN